MNKKRNSLRRNKPLEHIKKVCGGGEEADFVKHPLTEEEMFDAVGRIGCVSLQEIAFQRRKIFIRRK